MISCTKARPNLTCTFSVIFCTGRMSLLYPLNKSRTNLSSSSEHRPASRTINAINENDGGLMNEALNRVKKNRIKLKTRTPLYFAIAHFTSFVLSSCQEVYTSKHSCTSPNARKLSLKFQFVTPETAHLPTHRIAEIRNNRARRKQKYILGGFVVGLIVVPPERAASTIATAATTVDTDRYRSADAGQ